MWNGTSGFSVAPASQTAPAWARLAGPRGPSSVKATALPGLEDALHLQQSPSRPARRRAASRAIAKTLDDAGNPLAVEVLARDDDDTAAPEVVGGGKNATVPEPQDWRAPRSGERVQVLCAVNLPPQRATEQIDQRITHARYHRNLGPSPS